MTPNRILRESEVLQGIEGKVGGFEGSLQFQGFGGHTQGNWVLAVSERAIEAVNSLIVFVNIRGHSRKQKVCVLTLSHSRRDRFP